jgi:RimJ/RimL family protein N-acetyltransferase
MPKNPLTAAPLVTNTSPAHFPTTEALTGKHVILERLEKKHYSDLYDNIGSQGDIWLWWPDEPVKSAADWDAYMHMFINLSKDLVIYSVIPTAGPNKGKALGLAFALSEDRESNRVAELGLFYGPRLQGSREGTEGAFLLANLMFELNHRRLGWKTNSLNHESRKAAERYGFVYEGTLRQVQIDKGRSRDSVWYSIIDSEWPVCKKAFEMWLDDANFDEQQQQKRKLAEIRESLKKA